MYTQSEHIKFMNAFIIVDSAGHVMKCGACMHGAAGTLLWISPSAKWPTTHILNILNPEYTSTVNNNLYK